MGRYIYIHSTSDASTELCEIEVNGKGIYNMSIVVSGYICDKTIITNKSN